MTIFKCKMCGGNLEPVADEKVIECEYCGSKQTIPDSNDEKRVNLYNRANRFRLANEFDKAAGIYESLVEEFPEDAEAYWGLCLCNYGIEYVDDPATARKVPTCHRASFEKMRKDTNYEMALLYADISSRAVYEEQAKEIDDIMTGILHISREEEPYDIFICYKESDRSGQRTPDSVLAQEIYDALTQKSYRVFFSRITLEDKLGAQYEPYIFSALNSAKVMLVVGTDYENMNAVWVKNEWSRYIKIMSKDKEKNLIPCYKDMDPYDMPDEFRGLQSQDCSKIGFMQDLTRGIDKLFGKSEIKKDPVMAGANPTVESLLQRTFIFLEDKEWDSADEYCEKILDIEPQNAMAYLGKLMAEMHISQKKQLQELEKSFEGNGFYKKIVTFGDEQLKNELKEYIDNINDRNEKKQKETIYNDASNLMNIGDYLGAAEKYSSIVGYKDAEEKQKECEELNKEKIYRDAQNYMDIKQYFDAAGLFGSIEGYKDADQKQKECLEFDKEDKYSKAIAIMKKNDYLYAAKLFNAIEGYKDADQKQKECKERYELLVVSVRHHFIHKSALSRCNQQIQQLHKITSVFQDVNDHLNSLICLLNEKEKEIDDLKEQRYDLYKRREEYKGRSLHDMKERRKIDIQYKAIDNKIVKINDEKKNLVEKIEEKKDECRGYTSLSQIENELGVLMAEKSRLESEIEKNNHSVLSKENVYEIISRNVALKNKLRHIFGSINDIAFAKKGDKITFGDYHGAIEWIVLEIDGYSKLVISESIIDIQPYENSTYAKNWDESSLRKWLNSNFINEAFTVEEKAIISTVLVKNQNSNQNIEQTGKDTNDKVFLLSVDELDLISENVLKAEFTDYAIERYKKHASDKSEKNCWWLRTNGDGKDSNGYFVNDYEAKCKASFVDYNGEIVRSGQTNNVLKEYNGIRPVLWVET